MSRVHEVRTPPATIVLGGAMLVIAAGMLAATVRWIAAPGRKKARARQSPGNGSAKAPRTLRQFGFGTQRAASGVGPLLHRRYSVDIPRSPATEHVNSVALMRSIKAQIARLSPSALAEFRKTNGEPGEMHVGDEYDITMVGPWNGRVRVVAVARDSFTLITLKGHPESGHISFRVQELRTPSHPLRVSIESWARSRDAGVDLVYAKLGLGKHMQAKVWVTFLQRACALAGLRAPPRVRVTSEEVIA